jgi:hypothetical protein
MKVSLSLSVVKCFMAQTYRLLEGQQKQTERERDRERERESICVCCRRREKVIYPKFEKNFTNNKGKYSSHQIFSDVGNW